MSGTVVWVTLCEIDRNKVRLGFDASRCVTIEREEVVGMRRNRPEAAEPIQTCWGQVP